MRSPRPANQVRSNRRLFIFYLFFLSWLQPGDDSGRSYCGIRLRVKGQPLITIIILKKQSVLIIRSVIDQSVVFTFNSDVLVADC